MQLMRLAGKHAQLRAGGRKINGFVEASLAQHQSLIGAKHQPSGHHGGHCARLRARQQRRHIAGCAHGSGLLDRALIDIGWAHLDWNAGCFQERTPWRTLRCQDQWLFGQPERHYATGRRRRSVSSLSTAAAVSSIERRVTSIEGQLCLVQSLREKATSSATALRSIYWSES